jgi:flagellar biosynthetic protein FliP
MAANRWRASTVTGPQALPERRPAEGPNEMLNMRRKRNDWRWVFRPGSATSGRSGRYLFALVLTVLIPLWLSPQSAVAEPRYGTADHLVASTTLGEPRPDPGELIGGAAKLLTSRDGLSGSLQVMLLLSVVSLAPAILLMTTSFIRIVIVLGLLRQALGTQQLPPSQVLTSMALFISVLIMSPVWKQVYDEAIVPYGDPQSQMSLQEAWQKGVQPIRDFMGRQIEAAGNSDDVWLFYGYLRPDESLPETYGDVPLQALIPAFMLSELKVAFLIGFQIYLPFLVLDLVVASVTISMGMLMLPPVMISLPFKLLLFVLVDGWHLVIGMLLESFAAVG